KTAHSGSCWSRRSRRFKNLHRKALRGRSARTSSFPSRAWERGAQFVAGNEEEMSLPLDEIRAVIADAVAPRHFFIGNGLELEWEHAPAENIPWEIYKGRLLDASQTRERRTFEAWNIHCIDEFDRSTEPLLSVKLDAETGEVHVVRAILCYAWEAYESSANVI